MNDDERVACEFWHWSQPNFLNPTQLLGANWHSLPVCVHDTLVYKLYGMSRFEFKQGKRKVRGQT